MGCVQCVKNNKKNKTLPNCRICNKPFNERGDVYAIEEELKENTFLAALICIGVALAIVILVAGAIYWWAGI